MNSVETIPTDRSLTAGVDEELRRSLQPERSETMQSCERP